MITSSQQLWLDAGENRSHSLCTISVNVDCRDEFVVCYGVYAMSRLNFLTCGLEVLWQSNCLDHMAFRRQELCVIPRDCEKRLHGSSDLFRSQEAKRIWLCETIHSCWQWTRSKRGSYYLGKHFRSVTQNLGAVGPGGGGGGEGGTPIYKPYRHVPAQRVSFASISSLK